MADLTVSPDKAYTVTLIHNRRTKQNYSRTLTLKNWYSTSVQKCIQGHGGTRQSKAEDGRIRQNTVRQGPGKVETKLGKAAKN
jgi:hypothetical protein